MDKYEIKWFKGLVDILGKVQQVRNGVISHYFLEEQFRLWLDHTYIDVSTGQLRYDCWEILVRIGLRYNISPLDGFEI